MKLFHVSWNDPETVFYEMPWKKNFTVYPSLKRKVAEALLIKKHKPSLKVQEQSVKLELFN